VALDSQRSLLVYRINHTVTALSSWWQLLQKISRYLVSNFLHYLLFFAVFMLLVLPAASKIVGPTQLCLV